MRPARSSGRLGVALALGVASLLGSCSIAASSDASAGRDAPTDTGDACAGVRWLEVGRCVRASGASCLSGPGEPGNERQFAELVDGATIPVTIGHQGSSMLALAARTRGIRVGDPAHPSDTDHPAVVLTLRREDGTDLALYRARATFEPDPSEPGRFVCRDLPLIVDGVSLGGPVRLDAFLRDADGLERCGTLSLVVAP